MLDDSPLRVHWIRRAAQTKASIYLAPFSRKFSWVLKVVQLSSTCCTLHRRFLSCEVANEAYQQNDCKVCFAVFTSDMNMASIHSLCQVEMEQVVQDPADFENAFKALLKDAAGIATKLKVGSCPVTSRTETCLGPNRQIKMSSLQVVICLFWGRNATSGSIGSSWRQLCRLFLPNPFDLWGPGQSYK